MELEYVTSWQQHSSVMLLNLVVMIPNLIFSFVRIWQGIIVFPLKLIWNHMWKNKWLLCYGVRFSELWSWAKQTLLNPGEFLLVFRTKFMQTKKASCLHPYRLVCMNWKSSFQIATEWSGYQAWGWKPWKGKHCSLRAGKKIITSMLLLYTVYVLWGA